VRGERIAWQAPAGEWRIMIFTCVRTSGCVDYLSPESVKKFFSLTYDEYYKRFAPYFGPTITMTFFDDVGLRKADRRNWTPAFNEKFKQQHGFSPVAYYPFTNGRRRTASSRPVTPWPSIIRNRHFWAAITSNSTGTAMFR
jgi:hypothetical protein